ncbi:hypothetical protein DE4585_02679 [Mycobacteroides salmoniphilum]|uniref:Uncharacterized protein n=1 Tax=Mycobacteroides salmoniphilum TaxID=404941 RepID=A0A4R8S3E6_9MYCO|nr:hypothetical protein DE4585_02679 [Mycobacteroides salmoniphilum]
MAEHQPRKRLTDKESGQNKYAALPPPVDLSKTIASVDVSTAEVEQSGNPDWNEGAILIYESQGGSAHRCAGSSRCW